MIVFRITDYLKSTRLASAIRPYRRDILFRRLNQTDRERLSFYEQFVRRGNLVFDVGANMGNRTKVFLKLGARVVAFEPQQACAAHLESVAGRRKTFTLVAKALGAVEGEAEMLISEASVLSTLDPDWADAIRRSGRFANAAWETRAVVQVTTLDRMIALYGRPDFIKIDVEGFELEVLRGLSSPVPAISLEFATEYVDRTLECIDHMSRLGAVEGQLSYGESMVFALPAWQRPAELKTTLRELAAASPLAVGDLYIRSRETGS